MTNGDLIRKMTDEELAEGLAEFYERGVEDEYNSNVKVKVNPFAYILAWLKQEVEDD